MPKKRCNAHARWLRGMALLHGTTKTQDAKEEMQRAIEQARAQGKTAEVKQWEADFRRCFDPEAQGVSEMEPQAASSQPTGPIIEEIVEPSPEETQVDKAKVADKDPALQKGFFNRGASATVKKNPSPAPRADEEIKKVEAPKASSFDIAEVEAVLSSELKVALAPALQEQWKEARSAMESLHSAVSEAKEDVRTNREHQKAA